MLQATIDFFPGTVFLVCGTNIVFILQQTLTHLILHRTLPNARETVKWCSICNAIMSVIFAWCINLFGADDLADPDAVMFSDPAALFLVVAGLLAILYNSLPPGGWKPPRKRKEPKVITRERVIPTLPGLSRN